ncbi:MAG: DMT family transporter [Bacteroidota bacterium]
MNKDFVYAGELAAFCTTLCWSLGIFPFTEAARRLGPNSVNHFRILLAALFLSIACLVFLPYGTSAFFSRALEGHWLWFGLSGIVGLALGDYFGFTAFAILGTRIGSIFTTLSPAAALLLGYFLVNEQINLIGILGIFITITGVIWVSVSKSQTAHLKDHGHGSIRKGVVFAIASALCQGFGVVLANKGFVYKINGEDLPALHATWLRMVTAAGGMYLFTILRGRLQDTIRPVLQNKNKGNWMAVAGTLLGPVVGVSFSMYAIALLKDKPSVAQTIFSLVPVFVLPLAWLFYREKITWKAIAGALIAIAGVMILIWRDELYSRF